MTRIIEDPDLGLTWHYEHQHARWHIDDGKRLAICLTDRDHNNASVCSLSRAAAAGRPNASPRPLPEIGIHRWRRYPDSRGQGEVWHNAEVRLDPTSVVGITAWYTDPDPAEPVMDAGSTEPQTHEPDLPIPTPSTEQPVTTTTSTTKLDIIKTAASSYATGAKIGIAGQANALIVAKLCTKLGFKANAKNRKMVETIMSFAVPIAVTMYAEMTDNPKAAAGADLAFQGVGATHGAQLVQLAGPLLEEIVGQYSKLAESK